MSGVAGGNRIKKANVQATFDKYVKDVLEKVPGFRKAGLSGSVKVGAKADYGDLDLITQFDGDDKKEVKKRIIDLVTKLPSSIIVPFKSERYAGKKYYNSGEIISVLYPIVGTQDEYIQVDNIIALNDEEHSFKTSFLDLPAEKQGLILGLTKVILLEENPQEIFKRLGITGLPELGPNEEYEFNLSSAKLTLRKVLLDGFKTVSRQDMWSTTNWNVIKQLFANYNIDGTFEELLQDLNTKLKNPRSRNRIKGVFKSMVSVKSGEVGTPKGDNKERALAAVDGTLEENIEGKTVAIYAGGFKPPHKGHFANAKFLADKADELVLFIGPKVREGIAVTAPQAEKIWDVYKNYLPTPVDINLSKITPIRDMYEWVDENQDKVEKIIIGTIPGEEKKLAYFVKNKEKYPKVEIITVPVVQDGDDKFSATDIRSSYDYLEKGEWIPKEIPAEDRKKIVSIITNELPSVAELVAEQELNSTLDDMFTSRVEKLKEEVKKQEEIQEQPTKNTLADYITSITEYMLDEKMNILPLPEIKTVRDEANAANFFGKTAYYNPQDKEIVLYIEGRHNKDIVRSYAHEMIHHIQNVEGRLQNITTTNTNEDDSLLEIEKEAYLRGNITFRNWEDNLKNS